MTLTNVNAGEAVSESVASMLKQAACNGKLMRVSALGPSRITDQFVDAVKTAATIETAKKLFTGSVSGGTAALFPGPCGADLMSRAAMP